LRVKILVKGHSGDRKLIAAVVKTEKSSDLKKKNMNGGVAIPPFERQGGKKQRSKMPHPFHFCQLLIKNGGKRIRTHATEGRITVAHLS